MTRLFLVRHGSTAHTGNKLSGWLPGIPLTDEGGAQAQEVADALADVPLRAVYSSPIDRTMQTARPIAARHDLQVTVNRGIGEIEFGKWTDRSFKVLRRTKLWSTIQRFPSGARFPGGEAIFEVRARAVAEAERIRSEHPKDAVCIVSHADVIKLLLAHYLGMHMDLFQRIAVSPGSISTVAVSDEGPTVLCVNAAPKNAVVG